jgi:hypothetical protein
LEDVSFPIELDVYPNTFMVSTTISFSLQQDSRVQIELHDVAGRKMACPDFLGETMLDKNIAAGNHAFSAGRHEANLNRDTINKQINLLLKTNNHETNFRFFFAPSNHEASWSIYLGIADS